MKSVTDLVLLPPLELIPTESLSQQRSEELGLLNKERREMLGGAVVDSISTLVTGFFAGLFGWGSFLGVVGSGPVILFLLVTTCCMIFSAIAVYMLRMSVSSARAYRQMVIPPQLKIDAKKEKLLSDTAYCVNAQIADWNTAAEVAVRHDVGERYLQPLKKYRDVLSARVAQIKKVGGTRRCH